MSASPLDWSIPPVRLWLSSATVHIWRASLDQLGPQMDTLSHTLSADEQARTRRFRFEQDRRRFVAGRGILRRILSRYTGIQAGKLRFKYGAHGKPALEETAGLDHLDFNVAHSRDLVLYAVACRRQIGIDLEAIQPIADLDRVAEQFFSPYEIMALRSVPGCRTLEAFLACWTRKEAYIKARGLGLLLPLDSFDVSLSPSETSALLDVHGQRAEATRWVIREIGVGPGYAAALAVQGGGWDLTCWQWLDREGRN